MSESQVGSFIHQLNGFLKIHKARTWVAAAPARLFWVSRRDASDFCGRSSRCIVSPNAPLDVIEGYAWGHEWLIGTHKHPPMQAWWLGALAMVTGRAAWAHFFASQLAIVISFWAVWQTGRRMFSEQAALLGALLLEGVVYYNFTSPEFNPNVLQLPFWALIGLYFHRAIKEDRMTDWLACLACGALAASIRNTARHFCSCRWHSSRWREARRAPPPRAARPLCRGTNGFHSFPAAHHLAVGQWLPALHLCMGTAAWRSGFPPGSLFFRRFCAPAFYILSQLLALLPATLLFFVFFDHGTLPRDERFRSFDRDFLDFVTFGPFVLTLVMAIPPFPASRSHDMWAMPFWNFIGLWAISRFKADFPRAVRRFTYSWAVISVGMSDRLCQQRHALALCHASQFARAVRRRSLAAQIDASVARTFLHKRCVM